MSFRIFTLFSILTLGIFACGGEDTGANNGGDQDAGSSDAGNNGEIIGGKGDVGTPCLTHADCEGLVCTRSEVGYVCSSDCHSNDDCVPGWTCEPRITEPGNICVCRGDGREICDGLDNNCDGQVDEGEPWKLGCGLDGTCEEGVCKEPCPGDSGCGPNGECVDLRNDSAHCGACGIRCPSGSSCVIGECVKMVDLRKHCRDGAEAWRVSAFDIGSEYGFNLDAHVTVKGNAATPATGCGIADGNVAGIDNSFADLFGFIADADDINASIAEAIQRGDIEVMAYIRGYTPGGANDNIQLTLIINKMEYPQLVDVKAELVGGKIVATLDRLPLTLSGIELDLGEEPVELNLTINIFDVKVEIDEPGNETSAEAMLGGAVQYYGDGGLSADLADLIAQMGLDLGDIDIDDIFGGLLDISSNGADCDMISLGAQLRFNYNDSLCN